MKSGIGLVEGKTDFSAFIEKPASDSEIYGDNTSTGIIPGLAETEEEEASTLGRN